MKRRTGSASVRSWTEVDPARSAKTIVTVLRVPCGLGAVTAVPQRSQKLASGSRSAPQEWQRVTTAAPQPAQKRAPVRFAFPQLAHSIGRLRASNARDARRTTVETM